MHKEVEYDLSPLGGPRGTLEFSDECSLFLTGVSVSALSPRYHLLPSLWPLCPWYPFRWHISFPMDTALVQALLSSAWVISAAIFLYPLIWPFHTIPSCCRWANPQPPPQFPPPPWLPSHYRVLHKLPFSRLFSRGPHCCP